LEKKAVKDSWDKSGRRPKNFAKSNPNSIIELLLQGTTNTTLNDAILLDQATEQQRWRKKELEEERIRKIHELAAERAAISRYEKHSTIRESWAKARTAADNERLRRCSSGKLGQIKRGSRRTETNII